MLHLENYAKPQTHDRILIAMFFGILTLRDVEQLGFYLYISSMFYQELELRSLLAKNCSLEGTMSRTVRDIST